MSGLVNTQRAEFIQQLQDGKKMDCPCCGRYAQMYKRTIHHSVARKLIELYKMGGEYSFVHSSVFVRPGETSIGDFAKAKYWGLMIAAENTDDKKKTSGMWKLTDKGVGFVMDLIRVPRYALVFDDRVFGFTEDDKVSIRDCLASGGFDYSQLMGS